MGLTSWQFQLHRFKSQLFCFSDKFNPNLYRPVIVPPRPRIMQDFIANGGKVTAFTQPDRDNTVIQLRKPQVHKVGYLIQIPCYSTYSFSRCQKCHHQWELSASQPEVFWTRSKLSWLRPRRGRTSWGRTGGTCSGVLSCVTLTCLTMSSYFRSQPDLSKILDKEKSSETGQIEDLDHLADSDCEVSMLPCFHQIETYSPTTR